MADFKLNGVTFASESGGVVSLSNANIFPAGHIVQTKTAVKTTPVATGALTAGSWVQTGLSVDITPKFNNSKIYLLHVVGIIVKRALYHGLRIQRTAPTTLELRAAWAYDDNSANWSTGLSAYMGFDLPNTLSNCTYNVQALRQDGSGDMYWNYSGTGGPHETQLIAMEIKEP